MSQVSESACYPGPPEKYLRNGINAVATYPQMEFHGQQSICSPSPFSPHGGAKEWQSNELLLKDECMRKLAYVAPLDCALNATYYVNKVPKY